MSLHLTWLTRRAALNALAGVVALTMLPGAALSADEITLGLVSPLS